MQKPMCSSKRVPQEKRNPAKATRTLVKMPTVGEVLNLRIQHHPKKDELQYTPQYIEGMMVFFIPERFELTFGMEKVKVSRIQNTGRKNSRNAEIVNIYVLRDF